MEDGRKKEERLLDLGRGDFSASTCLYVPELAEGTGFESFQEIVAHLRAPDGCPWDREQTHNSLRTHLMEEAYETLEAIDSGEPASMREEFGDLLLQIVLNAQIASEAGQFNMSDVVKGIHHKIIHRHPHVFGDLEVKDVNGVLQNWERLKEKERGRKNEDKGLLDGVPLSLPALTQAQEYQDRAARVGFDWPEIQGVLDKIREEIEEVKKAGDESGTGCRDRRPAFRACQPGALEEGGCGIRLAGDQYEVQETVWIRGTGGKITGTKPLGHDPGGNGRIVE